MDVEPDVRAHDLASVGDGRVGDSELKRRRLDVALADGQVDVVADRPRPPVGDPAARNMVFVLAGRLNRVDMRAPARRRQVAPDLTAEVDPGRAPNPVTVGLV